MSQTPLLERHMVVGMVPSRRRESAAKLEVKIMSMKALYIRHKAQPGKRDEVKRVWEKYAREYVEGASGQIAYVYGFDDTDPDAIVAYQLYTGDAATDDFVNQSWYKDYQRETAALLVGQSEFRTITPQWIKGDRA